LGAREAVFRNGFFGEWSVAVTDCYFEGLEALNGGVRVGDLGEVVPEICELIEEGACLDAILQEARRVFDGEIEELVGRDKVKESSTRVCKG
jgi:hypothetical protein